MELSGKSTCAFVVSNPGRFNVDVQYEITGPEELQCHLQVEPTTAVVPVGKQNRCVLSFFPQQKCNLKDMGFSIKAAFLFLVFLSAFCSLPFFFCTLYIISYLTLQGFMIHAFDSCCSVGKGWPSFPLQSARFDNQPGPGVFFPQVQLWKDVHLLCWHGACHMYTAHQQQREKRNQVNGGVHHA